MPMMPWEAAQAASSSQPQEGQEPLKPWERAAAADKAQKTQTPPEKKNGFWDAASELPGVLAETAGQLANIFVLKPLGEAGETTKEAMQGKGFTPEEATQAAMFGVGGSVASRVAIPQVMREGIVKGLNEGASNLNQLVKDAPPDVSPDTQQKFAQAFAGAPSSEDFYSAAVSIHGQPELAGDIREGKFVPDTATEHLANNLRRVYVELGITPQEATRLSASDPALRAEIMAPTSASGELRAPGLKTKAPSEPEIKDATTKPFSVPPGEPGAPVEREMITALEGSARYAEAHQIDIGEVTSSAGARGENQILPSTARAYGFDPQFLGDLEYNRKVTQSILDDLNHRYPGDPTSVLIAYNAGPGVANRFIRAGRDFTTLPGETQRYLEQADRLGILNGKGFADKRIEAQEKLSEQEKDWVPPHAAGGGEGEPPEPPEGGEKPEKEEPKTPDEIAAEFRRLITPKEEEESENLLNPRRWLAEFQSAFTPIRALDIKTEGIAPDLPSMEDQARRALASRSRLYVIKSYGIPEVKFDQDGIVESTPIVKDSPTFEKLYKAATSNGGTIEGLEAYQVAARTVELGQRGVQNRISELQSRIQKLREGLIAYNKRREEELGAEPIEGQSRTLEDELTTARHQLFNDYETLQQRLLTMLKPRKARVPEEAEETAALPPGMEQILKERLQEVREARTSVRERFEGLTNPELSERKPGEKMTAEEKAAEQAERGAAIGCEVTRQTGELQEEIARLNDELDQISKGAAPSIAGIKTPFDFEKAATLYNDPVWSNRYRASMGIHRGLENGVLRYVKQAGLIDDAQEAALQRLGQNHVILRAVSEPGYRPQRPSVFSTRKAFRAIKGNETYKIMSPSQVTADNVATLMHIADNNLAKQGIVKAAQMRGLSIVEKETILPTKEQMQEALKAEANGTELDPEATSPFAALNIAQRRMGKGDFTMFVDGKLKIMHTDNEDLATVLKMPVWPNNPGVIPQLLTRVTHAMRLGITLPIRFVLSAFSHGQFAGAAFGERPGMLPTVPGADFLRGLWHVMTGSELYKNAMSDGALNALFQDAVSSIKDMDVFHHTPGWWNAMSHPLQMLEKGHLAIDNASRVGRYDRLLKAGYTGNEAAMGARITYLDHQERLTANWTNTYAQMIPFFTTAVKSVEQIGRGLQEKPMATLIAATLVYSVPRAINWYLNHQQDASLPPGQRYDELPWYERYGHLAFPSIGGERFRLPVTYAPNAIFGVPVEMLLDTLARNNPPKLNEYLELLRTTFIPGGQNLGVPQPLVPITENVFHTHLYDTQPLVPAHLQRLAPELQYGPDTSPTSKAIARYLGNGGMGILNASPMVIDNYLNNAGVLGLALHALDYAVEPSKWDAQGFHSLPGVGSFFVRHQEQSTSVEQFYQQFTDCEQKHASFKAAQQEEPDIAGTYQGEAWRGTALYRIQRALGQSENLIRAVNAQPTITQEEAAAGKKGMTPIEKQKRIDATTAGMVAMARRGQQIMEQTEQKR